MLVVRSTSYQALNGVATSTFRLGMEPFGKAIRPERFRSPVREADGSVCVNYKVCVSFPARLASEVGTG